MTPPGPPKQFDRDVALERALEAFWEHGYRGTSMRDLLGHMGIGRQSLYDTFGGKRELFLESLGRYLDRTLEPMVTLLETPGPAIANVHGLMETWIEFSKQGGCKGCLAVMAASEVADEDPEVGRLLRASILRFEDVLRRTLRRAQKEGTLSQEIDPLDLARMILSTSKGLAVLTQVHPAPDVTVSVVATLKALLRP